jgi:hypothetical protein
MFIPNLARWTRGEIEKEDGNKVECLNYKQFSLQDDPIAAAK